MLSLMSELSARGFRQVCGFCALEESNVITQQVYKTVKITLAELKSGRDSRLLGKVLVFFKMLRLEIRDLGILHKRTVLKESKQSCNMTPLHVT